MEATLTFLGGASEVGRVGVLLEGDAGRLLLDYGIQPDDPPRFPAPAPDIDALLLTHAHLDHCGLAPEVANRGTPIVSTPATRDLAVRMAEDTLRVSESEGYPAPFPKAAIGELLRQHRSLVPGRSAFHGGFEFNIRNAGHIPGAAMFHFPELDFLFTGDLHTVDTGLTRAAQPVKCRTLAIESTYSGREHPEREEVVDDLLSAIDAIVSRGGRVILPAFGLGRSQELLMLLAGQGYEVWLDGMGRDIARILQKHPGALRNVGGLNHALKQTRFVRHWRLREQALRGRRRGGRIAWPIAPGLGPGSEGIRRFKFDPPHHLSAREPAPACRTTMPKTKTTTSRKLRSASGSRSATVRRNAATAATATAGGAGRATAEAARPRPR